MPLCKPPVCVCLCGSQPRGTARGFRSWPTEGAVRQGSVHSSQQLSPESSRDTAWGLPAPVGAGPLSSTGTEQVGRVFQAQGTPRVMVGSHGQVVVGESKRGWTLSPRSET